MRKLFLIVRSNMRKAKGQTVGIVVLIMIAALMLNLWLMLSMDYTANFDRYHDKLNAEHVAIVAVEDTDYRSFLSQTLDDDKRVEQYRVDNCLFSPFTLPYNGSDLTISAIFLESSAALTRSIGKSEIIEDGSYSSGIYLPIIYKTGDVAIGNSITFLFGTNPISFTVCGFTNNVMMGSHNCGFAEFILTQDKYEELIERGCAFKGELCSIRLNDISENEVVEADLKIAISNQYPNGLRASTCYNTVIETRYTSQTICSRIISIGAFLVLIIALVVIASNIINFIQVKIKNLGVLKAVGYTSKQLVCSLLLQFLCLSLFAAIVGIAFSYCLFPALNSLMGAQTGIPYAIRFLPLPALISILILGGTVALVTWLASRRIKKIEPIVALRSGVATHNFKRNRVPLEKTKAPLNFALALKTTFSSIKNNITVCITILVLSLVIVFSGLLIRNVITDVTPFVNLIIGETTDYAVNINAEIEDDFINQMNTDSRVEKVYLFTTADVRHVDGFALTAMACDDFSMLNNQSIVYEGRYPKHDNEIAIGGKYAEEQGLKVGNEIEISAKGKSEKYLICGLTQISNYLGKDCLMTRNGYERLGSLSTVSYYINLVDGTDIKVFESETKDKFGDNINNTVNFEEMINSGASVYISLMTAIVIAILILAAIIIIFVLYLLVRTMLINKIRDYGILKSQGFTTKQLILQTALSFMPALIISTVIGLIASCFVINPLMSLFMRSAGIMKCTYEIPLGFVIGAGSMLVLFAFALACLMSLKIKKIAPRNLLVGE